MMMTSSITTALLFKRSTDTYATFNQKAQYLWEQNDDVEWYNLAKRTFECTKSMMSIRFFAIMNQYGTQLFDDYVTTLYDLGHRFGEMLNVHPSFRLAVIPVSNIVCFRLTEGIIEAQYNPINQKIRQTILEEGRFYIVSTLLDGEYYLRVTIMNPFTTVNHLEELLEYIIKISQVQLKAID
jgi:L-2,4-diaminobutyrate decarboxylase